MTVEERIIACIEYALCFAPLKRENLISVYNFASYELFELIVEIEEEFDIILILEITDRDILDKCKTIGDLIDFFKPLVRCDNDQN